MSYEATIKLDDRGDKRIYVDAQDSGRVWFNFATANAAVYSFMTVAQARELAAALLDAAADLEPAEVVGGTVDLRAEPVTGVTA